LKFSNKNETFRFEEVGAVLNILNRYRLLKLVGNCSVRFSLNTALIGNYLSNTVFSLYYRLALKYPGNSSVIRENVTSKVNYTLSRLDAGATYVIEIVTVTYFTFLKHRSYKTLQVPTQLKITTGLYFYI